MKTNQADKAEKWSISDEYINGPDDSPRFRVMGSAPYNQAWMTRAVQAVNEHSALLAVAEAAELSLESLEALAEQEGHGDEMCDGEGAWHTDFCRENGCILLRINRTKEALSALSAVREGGAK